MGKLSVLSRWVTQKDANPTYKNQIGPKKRLKEKRDVRIFRLNPSECLDFFLERLYLRTE